MVRRGSVSPDAFPLKRKKGSGTLATPLPLLRRGRCPLAFERHAQGGGCHFPLHQPQSGRGREVLYPCRSDQGVPVPGHEGVAILPPMKSELEVPKMNVPGFNAEASLYRTSEPYRFAASRVYARMNSDAVVAQAAQSFRHGCWCVGTLHCVSLDGWVYCYWGPPYHCYCG